MTLDLFSNQSKTVVEPIEQGAAILRGFAIAEQTELLADIASITAAADFRHLITPGGHTMSVAMTNCGTLGWVSDRTGYRYDGIDPQTDKPWPQMPNAFGDLAERAAREVGFDNFRPECCLINRYEPGTRLTLHQDRHEDDLIAPIVSVSLGLPAVFLFGGAERSDKQKRFLLTHGDVVVWGGPARFKYHGVLPIKPGYHPLTGALRLNLTFRKVK